MSFLEFRHGLLTYRLTDELICTVGVAAVPLPASAARNVLRAALAGPLPILATQFRCAFSNLDGGRASAPIFLPDALADNITMLILQGRLALLVYPLPGMITPLETMPTAPAPENGTAGAVHPRAIKLMHDFEGCRLEAYLPTPNDRPTIGWGMTFYPDGKAVKMGETITQAKADADFVLIVDKFAEKVRTLIGKSPTTRLQFGAMVCLAYNIGEGDKGFAGSTVLRKHKAGDFAGAAEAFGMWNKQAGKVLLGLTRRRAAEAALYLSVE